MPNASQFELPLLIASSSFTVVPSTFSSLPYSPSELAPVAMLANMANVTIVPGNRPYKTIKDLVDAAPNAIMEKATKADAEAAKAKLEEVGATVELK